MVHRVHVSRMEARRSYEHGNGLRWVEEALSDLQAGQLRSPYALDGLYKAGRNGHLYDYELECWPRAGGLEWDAVVRDTIHGLAGHPRGLLPGVLGEPDPADLRRLVESAIENRVGVE